HDFYGRGEPYLKKWTDIGRDNLAERGNNTDTQIPIYRYAEILLFIAEAENEANSGPTPEAYLAINEVRERAGIDPLSGLGQEQFREAVRKEREFELAFELKRFYDIKRWDIFMEVFTEYPNSQGNVQEHHVYYPIPQREIQLNPGLGPNEGYN
ncbi:MAG: RagB/SusD family nutrient uptake outer membrane protein, partial [Balneolales bacterium]